MKKTLIGFAVSSLLGLSGGVMFGQQPAPAEPAQPEATTQAQGRHHHAIDPNTQAQRLAKKLKLTAEQQSQIAGILSAQREQATGLRADTSLSQEDRRSKMSQIRADGESKIRALLTDEQKQDFDQMLQRRQEKQGSRKG